MLRVDELDISEGVRITLEESGIEHLFPPQEEAVKAGLLEGASLLISTPTASGKTLSAALAADKALSNKRKVVYLTPLRSLVWEKAEYLSSLLGVEAAAAAGDLDADASYLAKYDLVVATYEKMDSVLRHGAGWLERTGLIIIDEAHLISDPTRGPTLEVVLARLRSQVPDAQFLVLSATITNAEQVADLLHLKAIISDWRPTKLAETVYDARTTSLIYPDGTREKLPVLHSNATISLALWTVLGGGQSMVFAPSRKLAEDLAHSISEALSKSGLRHDSRLEDYADMLSGTDLDETLSKLIIRGVAFHHAGLSNHHRRIVESAFRERLLKVICATPTLAAGVNIPARTVIIPDLRKGVEPMSVMEYKQLAGRAGRPGYDDQGISIIIGRSPKKTYEYLRDYVRARPEPVVSQLTNIRMLRFHVLALIATMPAVKEIKDFLSKTLAAKQDTMLYDRVFTAIRWLEATGLIRSRGMGYYVPTKIGRAVVKLYVMPETALSLLKSFKTMVDREDDWELRALISICSTPDVPEVPGLQVTLDKVPDDIDAPAQAVAKALIMQAWIEEHSEQEIYRTYNAAPGDIYVLKEASSWIARAAAELAAVTGRRELYLRFDELSRRLDAGVRPELLELTTIPDVGRVRARVLYNAGFRTIKDIVASQPSKISSLPTIGPEIARRILAIASRLNKFDSGD